MNIDADGCYWVDRDEPAAFDHCHTEEYRLDVSKPLADELQRVRDLFPVMHVIGDPLTYDRTLPPHRHVPPSRWKRWRERKAIRWWLVNRFLPEAVEHSWEEW